MKPRVLFLDHASVLGGAELYLLDVARHYRETSRVVLFDEGPFYDRLCAEQIDVQVVQAPPALLDIQRETGGWKSLKTLPDLARLAWHVRTMARRYDVIFANSQKALVVGALAGLLARRPLVWNLHDLLTADHFSTLNRRAAVLFANGCATRIIANSEATRRAFAEEGGRADKTGVVYNGIAPGRFDAVSPAEVADLRQSLGLQDVPVAGVFSRLAPWKGQHVLLHALPQVPDLHVLLVGDALFSADHAYADELRRLTDRLNLRDRVHFLGFRDDVPALMKAVDVVVHTSVAPEPFGRVIVEGMLAGKPVVATRAGGALEIVEDEGTGLLVPPRAPRPLAQRLHRLIADPALRDRLAQAGAAAARERFSLQRMLEHIERQIALATRL